MGPPQLSLPSSRCSARRASGSAAGGTASENTEATDASLLQQPNPFLAKLVQAFLPDSKQAKEVGAGHWLVWAGLGMPCAAVLCRAMFCCAACSAGVCPWGGRWLCRLGAAGLSHGPA